MKISILKRLFVFLTAFSLMLALTSCGLFDLFKKTPACTHEYGDYTTVEKRGDDYFGISACKKCKETKEEKLDVVMASDKWLYDEAGHWNKFVYKKTVASKVVDVEYHLNQSSHSYDESGVCAECRYNPNISEGLEMELNAEANGYIVVGRGDCTNEHINIPAEYEGLPVVAIGDNAFEDILPEGEEGESGIEPLSVSIKKENGLRVLGVTIPDTVVSISCTAFSHCEQLYNFIVDSANTVFSSTNNCLIDKTLKTLVRGCEFSVIPDDGQVTVIGSHAFFGASGLVSITIPGTIEDIGDKAFMECDALVEVYMPENINIGIDVFRGSIHVEIKVEHTLVFVPSKEATCEEMGNIEYYVCSDCGAFYSDEKAQNQIYEVTIPASHDFVDGVCTKCGMVQDEILIVWIDQISHLGKFPLGTLEDAIGLPEYVNVKTKDGIIHTLSVRWDTSSYNKAVEGEYTITGTIQSESFRYEEGLTNKIEVGIEFVEFMVGTADIVFVLDISGSMSDEIYNVKENLKRLADAIQAAGVSANWSVITYSDYADCPGDPREETQIRMNGANAWASNAEDCKKVIEAISLAFGGDNPEVAVDGLLMANSLDTRKNARVFYILLTDAEYKVDNNYGAESMTDAIGMINEKNATVSVITETGCYSDYNSLVQETGGIMCNIYGNFSQTLVDALVPIIFGEVIS